MKGFARRELFVEHKLRNWQETGYEYYIISLKEINQKINRYLGGRQRIHRCQYITKGNGCKPPTPSFGTEEKAFVFLYSQIGCCILMYFKKKTKGCENSFFETWFWPIIKYELFHHFLLRILNTYWTENGKYQIFTNILDSAKKSWGFFCIL